MRLQSSLLSPLLLITVVLVLSSLLYFSLQQTIQQTSPEPTTSFLADINAS